MWRAIATYRSGDQENGRKLMEERQSIIESEIERYQSVKGMERYINLLYYSNFMMYCMGYDIFGADTIKFRACILLFASVSDIPVFKQIKNKYRW